MILDFDVGNTRVKWRLSVPSGAVASRGAEDHGSWREVLTDVDQAPHRVRMACVNGNVGADISAYCLERWGLTPELAAVDPDRQGLVCDYEMPSSLGVDRWLAALACYRTIGGPAVIADAGSALTIDVLAKDAYRGGYILPGHRLMTRALGSGTWGVRVDGADEPSLDPGRRTETAVASGGLLALVGAVEKAADRAAINKVVVTGGDGDLIVASLATRFAVIVAPDLVLDGLAVALP